MLYGHFVGPLAGLQLLGNRSNFRNWTHKELQTCCKAASSNQVCNRVYVRVRQVMFYRSRSNLLLHIPHTHKSTTVAPLAETCQMPKDQRELDGCFSGLDEFLQLINGLSQSWSCFSRSPARVFRVQYDPWPMPHLATARMLVSKCIPPAWVFGILNILIDTPRTEPFHLHPKQVGWHQSVGCGTRVGSV